MRLRSLLPLTLASLLALPVMMAHADTVIQASRVASGLSRPIYATAPTNDFNRLFVVEQHTGEVQILDLNSGELLPEPFLDIGRPSTGNEQGLLGLSFDPNYDTNGFLYVNYTDRSGTTRIDRFTVSDNPNVVDPDSIHPILEYRQPQSNHNGGWIGFGPDNYLYIASGDGGGANDTGSGHTSSIGNSQDLTNNLLGKMLRLDVSSDAFPEDPDRNYAIPASNPFVGVEGDDEIWSYGLRNPWRTSFDRETGDLYIGDVGQGRLEEINFQSANSPGGENYGWRLREGTIATPGGVGGPAPEGAVDPIHEYSHVSGPDGGFSVTGGYVYRGPIQELQGDYFFADFVTNQIWSLKYDGENVADFQNRTASIRSTEGQPESISSFAEDAAGNLYVVSLNGSVFRFEDVLEQVTVVDYGANWKYLDDGSDQGTDWRNPDFNDADWSEGPAELGYGDDPATEVSFGGDTSNRHATTYFRHAFDVDDPSTFAEFSVDVIRDDGAAVYLNGVEILRSNLEPDATFDSFATASVAGINETRPVSAIFSSDLVVAGTNTLAVEVHQRSGSSSDLRFDLRINGILNESNPIPGDFDGDQVLGVNDIDALAAAMRAPEADPTFDLNDDGNVDATDRDIWVQDLRVTWYGDANLDGEFNSSDLVVVFEVGDYETGEAAAGWAAGDWNGDGFFNTTDLTLAFTDGGYLAGTRQPIAAVPEPASGTLLLLGLMGLWRQRRIRRT